MSAAVVVGGGGGGRWWWALSEGNKSHWWLCVFALNCIRFVAVTKMLENKQKQLAGGREGGFILADS